MAPDRRPATAALTLAAIASLGTVSYYDTQLPSTMNPMYARTTVDTRTADLVFDPLVYTDPITHALKSNLLVSDADGRIDVELVSDNTVQLKVKTGITWHDGVPFTAKDVCFTVGAMMDEATASPVGASFRKVLDHCVVGPDGASVGITFRRVLRNPLEHLQFYVLPEHGFVAGTHMSPDLDFSARPTGTGPMHGTKGRRSVAFTRYDNPHHHAQIERLESLPGGDPFVNQRALLAGRVQGLIEVPVELRAEIAASGVASLRHSPATGYAYLAVNTHEGALADPQVREAIDLLLDRTVLRDTALGVPAGNDAPEFVTGPFLPTSPYYNREVAAVATADAERARKLLAAAGATEREGRWLWAGEALTLAMGVNATFDRENHDLARQIQNTLEGAGISVSIEQIGANDWARNVTTGQRTDLHLALGSWMVGTDDGGVESLLHGRTRDGLGSLNVFGYDDDKTNRLIDAFQTASTDAEARDHYRALHARVAADRPYLYLWTVDLVSAWSDRVQGVVPAPFHPFWNFDAWHIEDPT